MTNSEDVFVVWAGDEQIVFEQLQSTDRPTDRVSRVFVRIGLQTVCAASTPVCYSFSLRVCLSFRPA